MSTIGNEVITIQLGPTANYVGAHYFNIQNAGFSFNPKFPSEFDSNLLFREGLTEDGRFNYTPRLVLVDFDSSFTTLSNTGRHLEETPQLDEVKNIVGADNVEVVRADELPKTNEYLDDVVKQRTSLDKGMDIDSVLKTTYDLTNEVSSWPEVLTVNLHSRSLVTIPKPLVSNLSNSESTFSDGLRIWDAPSFFDSFEDNLRFQLESSDCLQGFHLLAETDNLFGGLANKCHEYLRDECGKKTVLTVPLYGGLKPDGDDLNRHKRLYANVISGAFNLANCHEMSDIVTPMSTSTILWNDPDNMHRTVDNLPYDGSSKYQSTSVLGLALELLSSSYRSKRVGRSKMADVESAVVLPGRKFLGAGVVTPYASESKPDCDIVEILRRIKLNSLCPFVPLENTLDVQNASLRGFSSMVGYASAQPGLLFVSPTNVRIPRTFPNIVPEPFDLGHTANYVGKLREINGLSSLCNTREMRVFFETLVDKVSSLRFNKIPHFVVADLEKPEVDRIVDVLIDVSRSYDVGGFL